MKANNLSIQPSVKLYRRIAAMLYDGFILILIFIAATAVVLPFHHNKAFLPGSYLYQLYLFIIWFIYYSWFCMHGGQTLGMLAWRIRIKPLNNESMNLWRIIIRFATAFPAFFFLGFGYLYALIDRQNRCWQDIFSGTSLVLVNSPHQQYGNKNK